MLDAVRYTEERRHFYLTQHKTPREKHLIKQTQKGECPRCRVAKAIHNHGTRKKQKQRREATGGSVKAEQGMPITRDNTPRIYPGYILVNYITSISQQPTKCIISQRTTGNQTPMSSFNDPSSDDKSLVSESPHPDGASPMTTNMSHANQRGLAKPGLLWPDPNTS